MVNVLTLVTGPDDDGVFVSRSWNVGEAFQVPDEWGEPFVTGLVGGDDARQAIAASGMLYEYQGEVQ